MLHGHRTLVWLFRLGIFVGLLSAVVTVIYFTPFPELYHANCERPCHELDWPMICRVKLSLEAHQILGSWCGDCPNNLTDCDRSACLTADGSSRRVLSANRQLPGPAIQVCENDIIVVDVTNKIPGQGVAVHWRGQPQRETPYMDGVSMVTQCPIAEHTTFQYKFRASQAGTHLWQVHTGNNLLDGLFGPFIVRQADRREVHRRLYDTDDSNHYIVINEWSSINGEQSSQSVLLINGKAHPQPDTDTKDALPFTKFNITAGKRHRFRVAYVGGNLGCPVSLRIENHRLLVIAIDGHAVTPNNVESIVIAPGERMDFVLSAIEKDSSYWLEVKTRLSCRKQASAYALLNYIPSGYPYSSQVMPQIHDDRIGEKYKTLTTLNDPDCLTKLDTYICLPEIKLLNKLPIDLAADKLDLTLYLPFDFVYIHGTRDFPDDTIKPRVNNITFMFPSSPLASQANDLTEANILCDENKRPTFCSESGSTVCQCVHVIDIPLHSRVEMLLIDKGGRSSTEHVFHLHGGSFYVVGTKAGIADQSLDKIKELNSQNKLLEKNLKDPLLKDTIAVPPDGVVAVRFRADNPGYWLLHDQKAEHWSQGLDVILHIGNKDDLPPVPENFPRCGSWVGPEYFLI